MGSSISGCVAPGLSITSPAPNATVHANFTVTGTVAPGIVTLVNVLIRNTTTGELNFQAVTSDNQGNWSASFAVNADHYPGNTIIMAWDNEVDEGITIVP